MKDREQIRLINQKKMEAVLDRTLRQGKELRLIVTGDSMRPLLCGGKDRVTLCRPAKIHRGDIVLFRRTGGRYILHRAVKVGPDGFYAAGDAQNWREGPISFAQVEGVVREIQRDSRIIRTSSRLYRTQCGLWMAAASLRRLKNRIVRKKNA